MVKVPVMRRFGMRVIAGSPPRFLAIRPSAQESNTIPLGDRLLWSISPTPWVIPPRLARPPQTAAKFLRDVNRSACRGVATSVASASEIDQARIGPETIMQDLPHQDDLDDAVRQQVYSRKDKRTGGQLLSGVEDMSGQEVARILCKLVLCQR